MKFCRQIRLAVILLLSSAALSAGPVVAQDIPVTIVAAGLNNPRGMTWDPNGNLIVAEAGTGGDQVPANATQTAEPEAAFSGGPTAEIASISAGCAVTLASGLPSSLSAIGEVQGVADVAYLGDQLFALVSGGGETHGNPDQPNGVFLVANDGSFVLLADLGAWIRDNPVSSPPTGDYDPDGVFFSMSAAPDGSALWVVESNSAQILAVTPSGDVERIADLSDDNQVPTAISPASDGGILVAQFSAAPYAAGSASVVEIASDGSVSPVWTGLTTVTGLALDSHGTLYAAQLATPSEGDPFQPGTGPIVRQTGPDSSAPVVTGLNLPVSLRINPDDALWVSLPAIGADLGGGDVLRIENPGEGTLAMSLAGLQEPICGDGTQIEGSSPLPTAAPAGDASEIVIQVSDSGFDPPTLTIPVGSTVIFANTGSTEHNPTSASDAPAPWSTGVIEPGGVATLTINEPGTYHYSCAIHPEMTGILVVQ